MYATIRTNGLHASSRRGACGTVTRTKVVSVRAVFGGAPDKDGSAKDAAFQAQQEVLAARRAKRAAMLEGKGATSFKQAREGYKKDREDIKARLTGKAPAEPVVKARPAASRRQEVVVEEEEEEEPAPKAGNPLAGFLGGLFGKK